MKGLVFVLALLMHAGSVQAEPAGWRDAKSKAMDLSKNPDYFARARKEYLDK